MQNIRVSSENISELYQLKCAIEHDLPLSMILMSEPLANYVKSDTRELVRLLKWVIYKILWTK
jgi:hypothetical protein